MKVRSCVLTCACAAALLLPPAQARAAIINSYIADIKAVAQDGNLVSRAAAWRHSILPAPAGASASAGTYVHRDYSLVAATDWARAGTDAMDPGADMMRLAAVRQQAPSAPPAAPRGFRATVVPATH